MAFVEFGPPDDGDRPGSVHEMSFGQLVGFLVRLFLAAVPAIAIASAIIAVAVWLLMAAPAGAQ